MVPGQRGLHPGVIDASESTDATPERWLAISVDAGSPIVSELLIEALLGLGARGVQEADGRLITYVPPPADPEAFVERAQAVLREATGLDDVDLTWCWQDHGDWSVLWRQGLGPRALTDRLVITPSWCEAEAPLGAVVVTIDPGIAFGTAEHETTRGALRLMDRALIPRPEASRCGLRFGHSRDFRRSPGCAWCPGGGYGSVCVWCRSGECGC